MISIETIRQRVVTAFKTAHLANYPTMLVNYPNFIVVDLEHQKDPFISVGLDFDNSKFLALGTTDTMESGKLSATFYYPEGQGTMDGYSYTDMLKENIQATTINQIAYRLVNPINVISFKGWLGIMNVIPFEMTGTDC